MNAEILCVGTELLLGNILNTNAQYLSEQLSALGIDLYYQTVVGDNEGRLKEAIELAKSRADLLLFSGGLGPTNDDITKEVVAAAFGRNLVLHQETLDEITAYFERIGREMTPNNKKQALVPENARILPNHHGTAPGAILEESGKIAVILPGPPKELIPMFEQSVRPYLREKSEDVILSKTVRVFGMGESKAATLLQDLMERQTNPTLAPYAKDSEVHLRITAKAKSEAEAQKMIDGLYQKVASVLGRYIYGFDNESLDFVAAKCLKESGLTVATAESCTGGYLAKMLTNHSGASELFQMGVVTYSNEAKEALLGVPRHILNGFGAVSYQTAAYMARGIRARAGSDLGVSITGIAGPTGGTEEKPVGLVYIGLCTPSGVWVKEHHFSGTRERIRYQTALSALNMIRLYLMDEEK